MKKRLLLLLCFPLIFSCSENHEEEEKTEKSKGNIINIIKDDYSDSIHLNKDVNVVYLEEFSICEVPEGSYLIDMYFNGDDTLRNAKVFLCEEDIYDKAKYNWITDTSINITLYESKGDSSVSLVARGMMDGSGSGVEFLE